VCIYISILGSYVSMGYVSSERARKEYRSNRGAVGGSRNVQVALVSSELNPFETASPSC
jgi:hypothetical protein